MTARLASVLDRAASAAGAVRHPGAHGHAGALVQKHGAMSGAQVTLDLDSARSLVEVCSEVQGSIARWHRLLPELTSLALERVRSDEALPGAHGRGGGREEPESAAAGDGEAFGAKAAAEEGEEGGGEVGGEEGGEERNKYAVSILRRVKQKMDGRDRIESFGIPGGGGGVLGGAGKMTVQEQVDMTIKDATNIEKLCEMYEGWTPWV